MLNYQRVTIRGCGADRLFFEYQTIKPIPFKGMGPKWAISTGKSMMNMNQSLSQG